MDAEFHFLKGNRRPRKKVDTVRKTLEEIGIGGSRVQMFNLSSAMAPEFARIARQMTDTVAALGPMIADERPQILAIEVQI
jgi:coenzyme F420-reducing hydrogenase delta subunit